MNPEILNKLGAVEDGLISALIDLFAHLPDTLFWIKNLENQIIWINPTVADHLDLDRQEILGKTDMELYPKEWALKYQKDDIQVIKTGQPVDGVIELLINKFGIPEWRKVTKLPIFDKKQRVIGTTGISVPFENMEIDLPKQYAVLSQILNHARTELLNNVTIADLAQFAGMSEATLNRRFQETLHISPNKLISQLRFSTACDLLRNTVLNISEISFQCGYKSPTAFSRAFKKQKNMAPREYRETRD